MQIIPEDRSFSRFFIDFWPALTTMSKDCRVISEIARFGKGQVSYSY